MRTVTFIFSVFSMVLVGCQTPREDVSAAVIYAPLVVPALPVYALAQGWQAVRDTGADRIYPPVGLTRAEVEEQIERLPGTSSKKEIFLDPAHHTERWVVRKGRAIVYARFQDGVTIAYKKGNAA
jgi:hypothetical protein